MKSSSPFKEASDGSVSLVHLIEMLFKCLNNIDRRLRNQIQELRRDHRTKFLPGEQARPKEEDVYHEDSSEREDDFTAVGEVGSTQSENKQHSGYSKQ